MTDEKLDVLASYREVVSIFRARFGTLFSVAIVIYALVAVVIGLLFREVSLSPITFGLSIAASTIYQGIVVELVRDSRTGFPNRSVMDVMRSITPVILPLVGAGLIAGLSIGVGLLLVLVPGLFLMTIWAVVAPVIVIERIPISTAFERSRELVHGTGWQVFAAVFTAFLTTVLVGLGVNGIGVSIASGLGMLIVATTIASTLTAPIPALAASVVYFRLLETDPKDRSGMTGESAPN